MEFFRKLMMILKYFSTSCLRQSFLQLRDFLYFAPLDNRIIPPDNIIIAPIILNSSPEDRENKKISNIKPIIIIAVPTTRRG